MATIWREEEEWEMDIRSHAEICPFLQITSLKSDQKSNYFSIELELNYFAPFPTSKNLPRKNDLCSLTLFYK